MRLVDVKKIGLMAFLMALQVTGALYAEDAKAAVAVAVVVDPQTAAFEQAVTTQKAAVKKIGVMQQDLKTAKKSFDATLSKESAAQDKAIRENMEKIDNLLGRKTPKVEACKPGEKKPGCVDCVANKGRCFRGFCCS